ncbi:hypothetical protein Hdeb2414_s0603g00922841 [Helianthus debilis subsp. tardiflorus]
MVMGLQKVFEGEEDKILGLTPTADIRPNHRREATGCEQVVHRLVVFTTQATDKKKTKHFQKDFCPSKVLLPSRNPKHPLDVQAIKRFLYNRSIVSRKPQHPPTVAPYITE